MRVFLSAAVSVFKPRDASWIPLATVAKMKRSNKSSIRVFIIIEKRTSKGVIEGTTVDGYGSQHLVLRATKVENDNLKPTWKVTVYSLHSL